jgi:hypothetical protein
MTLTVGALAAQWNAFAGFSGETLGAKGSRKRESRRRAARDPLRSGRRRTDARAIAA